MHTPGSSPGGDYVNFNGLRVEKSSIPDLVGFLVESDPMTIPDGGELEPKRRETVARLFRHSFQEEKKEPMFLASLGIEGDALRYLTGLIACRY